MITARPANSAYLAIIVLVAALAFPINSAWAASGNAKVCQPNTSCTVGEFLYDDEYTPIATATCNITSKNPDGSLFINSQKMTSASDGWYSHTFSAPTTEGVYRTQVCCKTISATFATTDVNTTTEQIVVGTSISKATAIKFSSTGTLPGGLVSGTRYYAINVNATTIKVATSVDNANAGTAIDLTSQGSGTHTVDSDDNMCLDKTFEVAKGAADSVWNASRASYTASGSFGQALQNVAPSSNDIAAATWGYSSRTFSGFGALASDIWNSATRTITGNQLTDGKLARESDVSAVKDDVSKIKTDVTSVTNTTNNYSKNISNIENTTNENRILLEQVVNKPIIKNFLEEKITPDLTGKINESKAIAVQLSAHVDYAADKLTYLKNHWSTLSKEEVLLTLQDISLRVGGEEDKKAKSVFGNTRFIKNAWEWQVSDQLQEETKLIKSSLAYLSDDVRSYGKTSFGQSQLQTILQQVAVLANITGKQTDTGKIRSLFGKVAEVEERSLTLEIQSKEVESLLSSIGKGKDQNESGKIAILSEDVQQVSVILTPQFGYSYEQEKDKDSGKYYRNKLFSLRGVIQANKRFLARNSDAPLASMWLEEGSIVFKSLITNPSNLISQTIPITLYLPLEVQEKDILSIEKDFTLKFDSEKKQFYVLGTATLLPSESKTIAVHVEDIWTISNTQVASLRKQADELYKPLVNTSYFGQAVTIKSDIDVSLDKILEMQKTATTPDRKIRVYHDAQIELTAVRTKIEKLKELVSLASSAGSLAGFVGGAQAIAVWGLIIIMVAGFVFLALYMKMLSMREAVLVKSGKVKIKVTKQKQKTEEPKLNVHPSRFQRSVRFAVSIFSYGIISVLSSGITMYVLMAYVNQPAKKITAQENVSRSVLGEKKIAAVQPEAAAFPAPPVKIAKIVVPKGETVQIRKYPLSSATIVTEVKESQDVEILDETKNWAKVNLNPHTTGWVEREFILQESKKNTPVPQEKRIVVVKDTPTGFLRVRKNPGGEEIDKVNPNDSFPLLDEVNGWFKIELKDQRSGWISGQYATVNSKTVFASNDH